jgi:hypothetical protein
MDSQPSDDRCGVVRATVTVDDPTRGVHRRRVAVTVARTSRTHAVRRLDAPVPWPVSWSAHSED